MPPRRSSRAPGPAEDPAPVDSLPTKRKRGQTAEVEPDVEKENATKPASRTRRSVSAKPNSAVASGSRRSTRSKVSLPDVAESGGEEQEDAPPVKKARPSVESMVEERVKVERDDDTTVSKPRQAGESEEDDEEDFKPIKGRRAATKTSKRGSAKAV
ncbi:hypothetical protein HYPSUDRAFT_102494, partial [Hypholoma sublateritium FD-334 SS-4]